MRPGFLSLLQDVTAQHLQKVQELEACKRDLQSGLIEKDEQIQALQSRLQEQTEAAKKTSLEYELKIGAMNREFEKMLAQTMSKLKIIFQHDEWMAMKARAAAAEQSHSHLTGVIRESTQLH